MEEQHKIPLARKCPVAKGEGKGSHLKNAAYKSTVATPKTKVKRKMGLVSSRQMGERIPWTDDEVKVLVNGILKYGAGKWAKIKADPEFKRGLIERDTIHLKDKVRGF